jgi:hypothetical protein
VAEFLGSGDQRAVTGDFVVLDGLGVRHDPGIEHRLVVDLARRLERATRSTFFKERSSPTSQFANLRYPPDIQLGYLSAGF